MENTKYHHHDSSVTVAVNDIDFKLHITPGAVMRYYQDIATEHAIVLGYGYEDMLARNLLWVVLRMSVKIISHPKLGETYLLRTFPEKPTASSVDRSYYMYDKSGELVTCGSSRWCVIDTETYRIQRCAPLFDRFDQDLFIPTAPFDDVNPKINKLPDADFGEKIFSGIVQVTHLDRNVHMNNACYGDIVLNACGKDMIDGQHISQLDINFISQLFYGDMYDVYKLHRDDVTYIEARKVLPEGSGETAVPDVIFRARAQWRTDE